MSDVALPNGQVNKWIVDRQPTAYDANSNGAVRIRKYPTEKSSAAVHWSYIGPNVPWQHCHDWQREEIIPGIPSLDDSDENGCLMAWTNSENVQLLHYKLVLDWMGWEPVLNQNTNKSPVAYECREWKFDHLPSESDADKSGNVLIVAYGQMPILAKWDEISGRQYYGWTHTDQWYEKALEDPGTDLQRLYISVSRSFGPRGQHIIDAVASDGTGWYLEEGVWYQHPSLPPVQ